MRNSVSIIFSVPLLRVIQESKGISSLEIKELPPSLACHGCWHPCSPLVLSEVKWLHFLLLVMFKLGSNHCCWHSASLTAMYHPIRGPLWTLLREADTSLSFTQPVFTGPLFRLEETSLFSQWTNRCKFFHSTPLPYSTLCWEDSFWSLIALWVHAWEITQSCPTLWSPMGCSPPGSSVHGILQARILEWVAMSSYRGSSQARDQTRVFCISWIAGGFFTV